MRPKGQFFDLKRFRVERGLTQMEIASAVNLPQSFISAIENGKRSASKSLLDKLADLYKVDNISDYLSDPIPSSPRIMKNIRNSMINSPGSINLTEDVMKKFSKSDLVEYILRNKVPEESTSTGLPSEASTILLNLLASADERYLRERAKVEALEEENAQLKRELKQYKK